VIFKSLPSGNSVLGQPIEVFKTPGKAAKYTYLVAGCHGDEVEGVYVLKELFEWLKSEHQLPDHPLIIIPILNPDGYQSGTRVNAQGVDLNRNCPADDWSAEFTEDKYNPGKEPLSEPENKFLMKLMDQYHPELVISFHSWKPIVNYNGDAKKIADFLGGYNNYEVSDDLGYPTPGSHGTYIPNQYGCGLITYELPLIENGATLKEIWDENKRGLMALFQREKLLI